METDIYKTQLKNKQKTPWVTLQQYEIKIARLVHIVYSTGSKDILDPFVVQTFTDGIRDFEIQEALRLGNAKKLEEPLAR